MHSSSKEDAVEEKKKRKRTIKVDGSGDAASGGDSKVEVKRIKPEKQVIYVRIQMPLQ